MQVDESTEGVVYVVSVYASVHSVYVDFIGGFVSLNLTAEALMGSSSSDVGRF